MSTEYKTHWVMDYETLSNCFVGVFEDYKENIKNIFIVHEKANHLPELIRFLERNRDNGECIYPLMD